MYHVNADGIDIFEFVGQVYNYCWLGKADREKVVNPSNLVASRILGWQ